MALQSDRSQPPAVLPGRRHSLLQRGRAAAEAVPAGLRQAAAEASARYLPKWRARAEGAARAVTGTRAWHVLVVLGGAVAQLWGVLAGWVRTTRIHRVITGTLGHRIFAANLVGLVVLLGGILWLNEHQEWLIKAKRDSLIVQGDIIAAAIAASASVDTDKLSFDPERLPEVGGARLPYRDDGFAAFEYSLRPERVGPVLLKLIQPSHNTRGRIYDREGWLVVDTNRGSEKARESVPETIERARVRTPWTRLTSFFDATDLQVYREISNSANGTSYPEIRRALRGERPEPALLLNSRNKQIVSLAVPIQRRNSTVGVLLLSTKPGEIDDVLAAERRIIASLGVMALLTTLMATLMLNRTIAEPVRKLSAAAEQVSQSINARAELPDYVDRRDEVGQLAQSFKKMTQSLYERIEASEKFAADVAHELKNPLAAARASAEAMSYARTEEQRQQLVEQVNGELKRLNRLITDVSKTSLLTAQLARQQNEPVGIADLVSGVVDGFRGLTSGDDITISLDIDGVHAGDPLEVKGHGETLRRVVTNLLDNAVSFAKPGDAIAVRVHRSGPEIEIIVEDQGPGIPDNKLEQIFDRFYSDRPESDRTRGKNSGLGLSISREIVIAHDGRIWAENRRSRSDGPIEGARFVVRLPSGVPASPMKGPAGLGWRQQA